jgi:hypothetical protein
VRRILPRLLPLLFYFGTARAAFECLPGPAAGGLSDWAWPLQERPGTRASASLGRPASIDGLAWCYTRAGWRARRAALAADIYSLGLDGLYRESSAGFWLESRGAGAGARYWRATWEDGTRCSGWTGEVEARRCRGPVAIRCAAQGIPLGRIDPSAPRMRFSAGAALRMGAGLVVGATAVQSERQSSILTRLDWSPLPFLAFSETVRIPGSSALSGIEIATGSLAIGIWAEPTVRLGLRTGVRCSVR